MYCSFARSTAACAVLLLASCQAKEIDETPPSVPLGVAAVSPLPTRVNVSWAASTDDGTGVGGYQIFRGGVFIATVGAPDVTFQDDGVAAATAYVYTVKAFDRTDPPNVSAASAPAGVTTLAQPDVTPPSVPTNVTATAPSPTRVVVSWTSSTDAGAGVAGYQVRRGGVLVGTVNAPAVTFQDDAVVAATAYVYTVRAFDAASPSNVSADSSTASVTTPPASSGSGLDARPSNTTCLAPPRPTSGGGVQLVEPYPNLPAFLEPVFALQAPGDPSRWFVVEKGGLVKAFDATSPTVSLTSTFIDISGRVNNEDEMGLLGMAFHPQWPVVPEVFLFYARGSPRRSVLSRFRSTDGGFTLDQSSEQNIFTVDRDAPNHNGGGIAFSPPPPTGDGYLYIGTGDGGGADDELGNGQRLTSMLAKFLRIDVQGTGAGYVIPPGNPYAGNARCGPDWRTNAAPCPEMFAFGFRNPWRWSFDRATGELWVGDVGQGTWEEVDKVQKGFNYGWSFREGAHCFNPASGCPTPGTMQNGGVLVDPILEYQHGVGESITGGYVYRGSNLPSLAGLYVFGDFSSEVVWAHDPAQPGSRTTLLNAGFNISSFAEGADGELYAIDFTGGVLHRLEPSGGSGSDNVWTSLADSGCVDTANPSVPATGLIPYRLNAPFWSDGALKERWMALPDGQTVTIGTDGDFNFPSGTVLMKSFRVGGKLVETRLLMRHPDGVWAGYTYEWNATETAATRVVGGKLRNLGTQSWLYPSQQQCVQCHTQVAGRSLGLEVAQQNGDVTYPATGRTANQLATLDAIGVFTVPGLPGPPASLPAYPDPLGAGGTLETRARAWLHSNCSQCHRPSGPTPVALDFRFTTALAATGACNVNPSAGDLGIAGARIIAPGSPATSIALERVKRLDVHRMPPVGSLVVDQAGVQLLTDWIQSLTGCN